MGLKVFTAPEKEVVIDELIEKLNELYSSDISKAPTVMEDNVMYFDTSELINEAVSLSNSLLISESSNVNYFNINILRSKGYRVFPGERDSFGWLTGCIQKIGDNRILVFG